VSVPAMVVAGDDGRPGHPVPAAGASLDTLVARLAAQYGADPRVVRARADEVLASFAGARVQAFVPLLVEKRLRGSFRGRTGSVTALSAHDGSTGPGTTVAVGRRP
jgi:hypothetical protein